MKRKILFIFFSLLLNIVLFAAIDVTFGLLVKPVPKQINKNMRLGDAYPSNYRDYFYEATAEDGSSYFWPGPEELSAHDSLNFSDEYRGYKVLAIGDSFTYGQGLRRGDTYSAQLSKVSHDEVRAENWGVSGDNIEEIHKRLLNTNLPFKPDLIVYAYVLNDMPYPVNDFIAGIEGYPDNQPGAEIKWDLINLDLEMFEKSRSEVLAVLCRYSNLVNYFVSLRERDEISNRTIQHYLDIHDPRKNIDEMTSSLSKVAEMRDFALKNGAEFLVVIYPILFWPEGSYPLDLAHEMWSNFLDAKDIDVLDMRKALMTFKDKELWVHPIDQHPNNLAQKIVAEEIYSWIKDNRKK